MNVIKVKTSYLKSQTTFVLCYSMIILLKFLTCSLRRTVLFFILDPVLSFFTFPFSDL